MEPNKIRLRINGYRMTSSLRLESNLSHQPGKFDSEVSTDDQLTAIRHTTLCLNIACPHQ